MDETGRRLSVRALEGGDAEPLQELDARYSSRLKIEPTASQAAANFHSRTGHSFVAVDRDGRAHGFVLAHALWTGGRPTVRVERLAAGEPGDSAVLQALAAALVKSAYDAGVYDLIAELPEGDSDAAAALGETMFTPARAVLYTRTLGSRGQAAAR